jgi:hypothetical protein
MNDPERKETAYHEAGHAVMGFILGRTPSTIDIIRDADGNAGHTDFASDLLPKYKQWFNQSPEKQQYLKVRVLVSIAGTAAHDLLCPGRQHDSGDERDEAAAKDMIMETRSWADDHDIYLHSLKILARTKIIENWKKVEEVANMLLRCSHISGDELIRILRGD